MINEKLLIKKIEDKIVEAMNDYETCTEFESENELKAYIEGLGVVENLIEDMLSEDIVEITCYGRKEYRNRIDAEKFYTECYYGTEGAERERYASILVGLREGLKKVDDGEGEW